MASAREKPNMCSAALFQNTIFPSSSAMMMASFAAFVMLRS